MERRLDNILPILGEKYDRILSKQGNIAIACEARLPSCLLACQEYEAFHRSLIKAAAILPKHAALHWFREAKYAADLSKEVTGFSPCGLAGLHLQYILNPRQGLAFHLHP